MLLTLNLCWLLSPDFPTSSVPFSSSCAVKEHNLASNLSVRCPDTRLNPDCPFLTRRITFFTNVPRPHQWTFQYFLRMELGMGDLHQTSKPLQFEQPLLAPRICRAGFGIRALASHVYSDQIPLCSGPELIDCPPLTPQPQSLERKAVCLLFF